MNNGLGGAENRFPSYHVPVIHDMAKTGIYFAISALRGVHFNERCYLIRMYHNFKYFKYLSALGTFIELRFWYQVKSAGIRLSELNVQ
jgi:hypothetical protein